MIGRILFGLCTISAFLVLLVGMLFMRSLPGLMRLFLQMMRQALYLSYLMYEQLLSRINGPILYSTGFSVLEKPYRTAACMLFSTALYLLLSFILGKQISIWILGCWGLHGFLVGHLWKDFFDPEGLEMGEELW